MAKYQTVNLQREHMARARALAEHRKAPITGLLADLVNAAYEAEFGEAPSAVTDAGNELRIVLGDQSVRVAKTSASSVAQWLLYAADTDHDMTRVNLDLPEMLSIARRGTGIIVETLQGQKFKHTMGAHQARTLASQIVEHI